MSNYFDHLFYQSIRTDLEHCKKCQNVLSLYLSLTYKSGNRQATLLVSHIAEIHNKCGQSNLPTSRIAVVHGRFIRIRQVASMCTPRRLSWVHQPSPYPKRHLDRFSRFCRAHDCDRQTDRQPDHATPSVTIGASTYIVLRFGLTIGYKGKGNRTVGLQIYSDISVQWIATAPR